MQVSYGGTKLGLYLWRARHTAVPSHKPGTRRKCPKRGLGDKQSTKDKVTSNRGDPCWFRAGTPIKLALKDI